MMFQLVQLESQCEQAQRGLLVAHDETFRPFELDGAEVPDSFNAGFDELVANRLCGFFWSSDDPKSNIVGFDELGQVIRVHDRNSPDRKPHHFGVAVKETKQLQVHLLEVTVARERRPEVANSDDDDALNLVHAENLLQHFNEQIAVVAEAGPTKSAEIMEVLAKLGRFDAERFADLGRADMRFLGWEERQIVQVASEAVYRE